MRYQELWLHLLNAELDQGSRRSLELHLAKVLGRRVLLDDAFFLSYRPLLLTLRSDWANLQTGAVLEYPPQAMPRAMDDAPDAQDPAAWLAEAATAGFAAYVHDRRYAVEPWIVDRCVGITPQRDASPWAATPAFAPLADRELVHALLGIDTDEPYLRCGKLFVRVGRSDYCCKACRDRTFTLSRRQRNPRYDADKQRRYRQRRKQPQSVELPAH